MKTTIISAIITAIIVLALICLAVFVSAGPQTASGATADDIATDVRYLLNAVTESGVTDSAYSDAEMLQWINDGQKEISETTHCLQDTETLYMANNTIDYTITSGTTYIKAWAVVYTDEDGEENALSKGSVWGRNRNVKHESTPSHWYDFNGKLSIYPPLSAISGTTPEYTTVFLSHRPETLTATSDSITLPALLDEELTDYVYSKALLKFNPTQSKAVREQLNAKLLEIRDNYYLPALVKGGAE